MVNHHVVRFDVAVHDPVRVAVLESLRAQRDQRVGWGRYAAPGAARDHRRARAGEEAAAWSMGRLHRGIRRAAGRTSTRQVVRAAEEGCVRGWRGGLGA